MATPHLHTLVTGGIFANIHSPGTSCVAREQLQRHHVQVADQVPAMFGQVDERFTVIVTCR